MENGKRVETQPESEKDMRMIREVAKLTASVFEHSNTTTKSGF